MNINTSIHCCYGSDIAHIDFYWTRLYALFCRESGNITLFFCRECRIYALFCRECRDYALSGVEFYTEFRQKFLEILRILAEILSKKMAGGASVWHSNN